MSRLTLYDHLGLPKVRYPYLAEFEFILKELQHYKDLEEQGRLIETKHGRWLPNEIMVRSPYANNYHCSECGKNGNHTPYCPNCGAKMDEVNDER